MFSEARTFHILGGGLSGLSAAKFLRTKFPHDHIVIYEAAPHLGGRCYSFYDKHLDRNLDNATHVVLGANKATLQLLQKKQFHLKAYFQREKKIHHNFWQELPLLIRSVFNTEAQETAPSLLISLILKLFPFTKGKRKIYFSQGDLSENLILPLKDYANEINTGWILKEAEFQKEQIIALKFNHKTINLNPQDIVISALDSYNYHKIFNGPTFEYNSITDIYYRTSVPLTLPHNIPFLGTPEKKTDWIFINKDIVAVTISNSGKIETSQDTIAREIWKEIRAVNGLTPAFLPPYKILHHKRATIKQDKKNNNKRPTSAQTQYKNLFICGDWTMKNYPCCLEAAVKSAQRICRYIK